MIWDIWLILDTLAICSNSLLYVKLLLKESLVRFSFTNHLFLSNIAAYASASNYSGVDFLVMNVLELCLDDWIGLYDTILSKFPREKMKQFNMQNCSFLSSPLSFSCCWVRRRHLGFLSSLLWSTISRAHRAKWLSFLWFSLSGLGY